jgi:hypothetical protein
MPSYPRFIPFTLRASSLLLCLVNIVAGATPSLKAGVGRGPGRARFVAVMTSTAGSADPADTTFQWNLSDRELPLLGLPNRRLSAGLDQSLSYPLDQSNLPLFQTLSYDEEHSRFLLPSLSTGSKNVHFIEFVATGDRATYTSNDGANIKLVDNDNMKTVRTSDGTRYIFVRYPGGEFRCATIKDAQGVSLNLLYTANGLLLHGLVDSSGRTITFNYAKEGIQSITQTWMANSEGLTKTWLVGEQPENLLEAIKYSHAVGFAAKSLPSNAVVRQYSAEMAASDKMLAQIFGGQHATAGGNGFEPAGLAASYPLYRGDIIGDDGIKRRGHLSYAMHLYGNTDGTGDSPLYIPTGFTTHSDQPSPTDAVVIFYYPRLGNLTDVTLAVFHVADFQIRDEGDRIRIGSIGGPGGSSASYKHSHIEFYRGNTGLPPLNARAGIRIDPAKVFAAASAAQSK